MRLLVVEDEHSLREDIARKLRLSGYEVDACADGEAALEALAAERYDLVLLDLNLPKVDGMQVLRTLRRHDLETCVLILSARSEIADKYTRPGASTLGGNPVSSTAGIAVLDYIEEHNLVEKSRVRGKQLKDGLIALQEKYPFIGDVRGLGLMVGAELINPDKSPAPDKLEFVVETMKDRGFLIGKNGIARNVLAFQPPLVISEENINDLLNNLDDVMSQVK